MPCISLQSAVSLKTTCYQIFWGACQKMSIPEPYPRCPESGTPHFSILIINSLRFPSNLQSWKLLSTYLDASESCGSLWNKVMFLPPNLRCCAIHRTVLGHQRLESRPFIRGSGNSQFPDWVVAEQMPKPLTHLFTFVRMFHLSYR